MSDAPEDEDLYARLESLSKSLEACDRIDGLEDRSAYPTILDAMNFVREAEERIAAAQAQLPDGMKHCTIVFKECDKGHGWLTATNWVQHGCPTCALEERHKVLAAAKDFDVGVDLKKAHDRAVEYANQAREACFEPTSFDLPQVRAFWRHLYAKEFAALTRP